MEILIIIFSFKFFICDHHYHPYTVEIETNGVPYDKEEYFCRLVEEELQKKGEKISRDGRYFKIDRYQAH